MCLKRIKISLVHHVLNRLSPLIFIILTFLNPLPFKLPKLFSKRISILVLLYFKFCLSDEFRLLQVIIIGAYHKSIIDLHILLIDVSVVLLDICIPFIQKLLLQHKIVALKVQVILFILLAVLIITSHRLLHLSNCLHPVFFICKHLPFYLLSKAQI